MGDRIKKTYRLDVEIVAKIAEIAERRGVSATTALEEVVAEHVENDAEKPVPIGEEQATAQDADAGEIALLREQVSMLRGLLEAEQRNLEVAQGNVAAMADALKATQAVAALDKGAAPGTALEVAQGAPRLTFRQWLAQRWAR